MFAFFTVLIDLVYLLNTVYCTVNRSDIYKKMEKTGANDLLNLSWLIDYVTIYLL